MQSSDSERQREFNRIMRDIEHAHIAIMDFERMWMKLEGTQKIRSKIHEDSPSCTRCKKKITNKSTQWFQCSHLYCSSCVESLISRHLRVFSTIPTCIHSKCDQPLNMSNIPSLPIPYSTSSFHKYSKRTMLIEGYMRNIGEFIPSDIVSIVSDYHHNNLHKPTPCVECKHFLRVPISKSSNEHFISKWYPPRWHMSLEDAQRLNIGDLIDHRDEMGRFRHAVIIDKQDTNLRIHYEQDIYPMFKCLVYDKWSDFSVLSELRRFAKYNSLTKRPCDRKEFKFNEIRNDYKVQIRRDNRWFSGHIEEIDETSAQVLVRYEENGEEDIFWTHLDNAYEIKHDDDSKPIHCSSCKGDKICMTLNLGKLCKTQSQCVVCNKYHPRNSIMHWTNCHHVVCVDCLLPYAKSCVTARELPICPDVNCKQEIGGNNFNFISYQNKNICTDLKTLFDEKYRFKCVYCNKWHNNSELCDDIDCDHKYRALCRDAWSAIVHYTDCIECIGKCELCQDYSSNKRLRKWGLCRHKYHVHCAKIYIDGWLPQQHGFIAGIFCKNKLPLCTNKDCGSFLNDKCAEMFHITRHQMRMLNELRNEITVDDDHFDDEWVQINFEDIEGFEASG